MKKLFLSFALMLASLSMLAQTSQSHTVQRGETIESVAKKYGISVSDLQQANPSTRDYFYAGMKLVIPRKANTQNVTQTPSSNSTTNVSETEPSATKTRNNPIKTIQQKVQKPTSHSDLDGSDFTSVALTFGSDFTDLVGMTYGIQGQYFLDNGFGATLTAGANYGLEDDADPRVQNKAVAVIKGEGEGAVGVQLDAHHGGKLYDGEENGEQYLAFDAYFFRRQTL